MLEEFKEETIVDKVGGRFKLSTLIQKRLVALNRGAPPLVEMPGAKHMQIVVAEIMNDKIYLDAEQELAYTDETAQAEQEDAGPSLSDVRPD